MTEFSCTISKNCKPSALRKKSNAMQTTNSTRSLDVTSHTPLDYPISLICVASNRIVLESAMKCRPNIYSSRKIVETRAKSLNGLLLLQENKKYINRYRKDTPRSPIIHRQWNPYVIYELHYILVPALILAQHHDKHFSFLTSPCLAFLEKAKARWKYHNKAE